MRTAALCSVVSQVRAGRAHPEAMAVLTASMDHPGQMGGLIVDALDTLDGEDREGLMSVIVALGCFASAALLELCDETGVPPEAVLARWGLMRA